MQLYFSSSSHSLYVKVADLLNIISAPISVSGEGRMFAPIYVYFSSFLIVKGEERLKMFAIFVLKKKL